MPRYNRIFISFAIEDKILRGYLVGHAKNDRSPFSFIDMSVREPWASAWKTKCRAKIRRCDGMIGIITKNTRWADGQLWELTCAYEEGVPVLLIYGYKDDRPSRLPPLLANRRILRWNWHNVASFLDRL